MKFSSKSVQYFQTKMWTKICRQTDRQTDKKLKKIFLLSIILFIYYSFEAGRGAAARGVIAKPTGCGFDPHSTR